MLSAPPPLRGRYRLEGPSLAAVLAAEGTLSPRHVHGLIAQAAEARPTAIPWQPAGGRSRAHGPATAAAACHRAARR